MFTEELDVYKKAHALTLSIYKLTESFPRSELYGLVSQMRRSASSINANLMEGGARRTINERIQFIGISRGSASELKYHIILARDLGFMDREIASNLIKQTNDIGQMLSGMIKPRVPSPNNE
ncbi:MAG: four helix bundle protein [Rickettsiales bacterium]|jgi:four helix bundle protein|nr:four helix bundle protein [Rickettsiales bacterium]